MKLVVSVAINKNTQMLDGVADLSHKNIHKMAVQNTRNKVFCINRSICILTKLTYSINA